MFIHLKDNFFLEQNNYKLFFLK